MHDKPIETYHPLSESDRLLKEQVLSEFQTHGKQFKGTLREMYDGLTARTPISAGVTWQQVDEQAIAGWWCQPEEAVTGRAILFIHGGAYMLGSAKAYRGIASQLAARAGAPCFVLDYPLSPEHPFPAAPEATQRAIAWLARQGMSEIALAGDSAGGALALGALSNPQAISLTSSVVVFSPWLDLAFEGESFNDPLTNDPVFQRPILTNAAKTYLNGADARHELASPLHAIPDHLPPLALQVGTDELLLDDATRYAHAAASRGGIVCLDIYEGMHHVFQNAVELAAARHALDAAATFIDRHWKTATD